MQKGSATAPQLALSQGKQTQFLIFLTDVHMGTHIFITSMSGKKKAVC